MGGTGANHVMLGTGDAIWLPTPTENLLSLRTTNSSPRAAPTPASSTKSKIQILRPAPTTGIQKMVTAAAPTVRLRTVVEPTPIVPTSASPVSAQIVSYLGALSTPISPNCRARSLLSPEQLQSRILRQRQQRLRRHRQPERDRIHHSAIPAAHHRR